MNDKSSQCPLSNKFGAEPNTWEGLLLKAYELDLNVVGVAFHVGSGCTRVDSFTEALNDTAELFELSRKMELQRKINITEGELNRKHIDFHTMNVIDIGGGFPGDAANQDFPAMVKQINDFINGEWCKQWTKKRKLEAFPEYDLTFISEPGRFFAHQSTTLITNICGLKICQNEERKTMNYYLNDGVYGSFNNLVYDHAIIKPPLHHRDYNKVIRCGNLIAESSVVDSLCPNSTNETQEDKKIPVYFSRFFGPTCDGFDVIMEIEFPLLAEGEVIVWFDMGAYTQAAASKFNGFEPPKKIYLPSACNKDVHRSRGYI